MTDGAENTDHSIAAELINGFCSALGRRELYADVSSYGPIILVPSSNHLWYSENKHGRTTIFYAPTDHPEACLAHELLHAKLKCHGYKQYCISVCLTAKDVIISPILTMLDNELQHRKFFPEFLGLGFEPSLMYHDSDSEMSERLHQSIAALSSEDLLEMYLNSYVSIIAPGGVATEEQLKNLEQILKEKCPLGYWDRLCTIRDAMAEFGDGSSLEAGPTIIRILQTLGGYEPTWIGWDEEHFPYSGYFVGKSFTIEDAEAATNHK